MGGKKFRWRLEEVGMTGVGSIQRKIDGGALTKSARGDGLKHLLAWHDFGGQGRPPARLQIPVASPATRALEEGVLKKKGCLKTTKKPREGTPLLFNSTLRGSPTTFSSDCVTSVCYFNFSPDFWCDAVSDWWYDEYEPNLNMQIHYRVISRFEDEEKAWVQKRKDEALALAIDRGFVQLEDDKKWSCGCIRCTYLHANGIKEDVNGVTVTGGTFIESERGRYSQTGASNAPSDFIKHVRSEDAKAAKAMERQEAQAAQAAQAGSAAAVVGSGAAADDDDEDMEDAGPAPTVTSVVGSRQQGAVLQYEVVFSNSVDDSDTEWHDGGTVLLWQDGLEAIAAFENEEEDEDEADEEEEEAADEEEEEEEEEEESSDDSDDSDDEEVLAAAAVPAGPQGIAEVVREEEGAAPAGGGEAGGGEDGGEDGGEEEAAAGGWSWRNWVPNWVPRGAA